MVVTKAKLKDSIYKLFYNTIVDNYGNPHTTRFLVYPSFPLDKLTDRKAYPLIIIDGPYFSEDEFTFRETEYLCDLDIMIYNTGKKDLCIMVDDIVNLIENRTKSVFETNGVEFLKIDSDGSEPFDHGSSSDNSAILGHVETITFEMKVYLSRIVT